MVTIINCLCTIALTSSSTNNDSNRIDPIVRSLKKIVDTALEEEDTPEDIDNDSLMEQLSQILEHEEGFRLDDRKTRSIYSPGNDETRIFDGSGDIMDNENKPSLYSNISIIAFTMGTTTTAFSKYTPRTYSPCRCEKGERGVKGDPGVCPTDCRVGHVTSSPKDCIGSQINLEYLAQAIRQLIIDSKKIAYRNALAVPCVCTPPSTTSTPMTTTTTTTVSNQFTLDYNTYMRLKGAKGDQGVKGDAGTSCSSTCMESKQTNVRVFKTLQQAIDSSTVYPDHTYIHIVNDYGHLQGVFIRVNGQLIPLRIENDNSYFVNEQAQSPTTLSIPKPQCTNPLPCNKLHMFAVGPNVRRMCNNKQSNTFCSKLSDYNGLCQNISNRQGLQGVYQAFMSTSVRWLSNLFSDVCVTATIVNTREQILFDNVDDMFQQKPPQTEVLDVQGSRPSYKYWWHGTNYNGSASTDTCRDWSRLDSSLSGTVSRMPDHRHGLFHQQHTWPCSIGDANVGILCIETNCRKVK